MKKTITLLAVFMIWLTVINGVCFAQGLPVPPILQGRSFVYDELEEGTGTALYTLILTGDSYRLYCDEEGGLVAAGSAFISIQNMKQLILENGDSQLSAGFTGSAFEAPSVKLELNGEILEFTPAFETDEYVYISYVGAYENADRDTLLILERWFEYYIYTDDGLERGSYEIYADGRIELTAYDGEIKCGSIADDGAFVFENDTFSAAEKSAAYEASHAMGEYVLAIYEPDVFLIYGVDGLVKALGNIELSDDGGTAAYFPRKITGDMELDERFTLEFKKEGESLIFPDHTYLLPRSGNVDDETGKGSYWSAGTTMEFIKKTEVGLKITAEYALRQEEWDISDIPLEFAGDRSGLLRQSMPSLGMAKPLVLLIDFPDQSRPRFITAKALEHALFDINNEDSLSAYYFRSSYGNLSIDGKVMDWYRAQNDRSYYTSDKEIMREAIEYHMANGLNLSDYDADGDGEVDSLYVLWAGNMDSGNGMWTSAYRSSWHNSPEEWGTAVKGYIFVPGTTVWSAVPPLVCNLNSLTHESGHLLGLNDYYSYDTTSRNDDVIPYTGGALEGGLGGMDMMDVNMGDHNAFSKWLLGWLGPQVIEYEEIAQLNGATYTLHPSNEAPEALFIKLKPSDGMFTEYLVVEVVSATMNASEFTRIKDPVVRVMHVDATLGDDSLDGNWRAYGFRADNSYTTTKFISTVEADGRDEVLNHLPASTKLSYDIEDYFAAGDALTPNTYPNTNGYDEYGNATVYNGLAVYVDSISETGEAVIRLEYEEQADRLSITGIEPAPAIVPYADAPACAPAGTDTITVAFDREVALAGDGIFVVSGNRKVGGWHAETDGCALRIVFDSSMESGKAYTVVIPQGTVVSADDNSVVNNFNSIFGFIIE